MIVEETPAPSPEGVGVSFCACGSRKKLLSNPGKEFPVTMQPDADGRYTRFAPALVVLAWLVVFLLILAGIWIYRHA